MRAVELFAGIGGFRLGLEAQGIETVWANEIREKSAAAYQANFGSNELVVGDIREVSSDQIPDFELLTAGFPCQPFSSAGKKLGIRCEENGNLFREIIRILEDKKPEYFILENVKRILTMESGSHFETIVKELSLIGYFVEWRLLDSSYFGVAQSRQRVFIVGSRRKPSTIGASSALLTTRDEAWSRLNRVDLDSVMKPICGPGFSVRNWGVAFEGRGFSHKLDFIGDGSARVLLKDIIQADDEVPAGFDFTAETKERLKTSTFVNRYYNGVQILWNQEGGARFGYTVFGTDGITSTLTASTSRHYERYSIGDKFRRLTNVEYARLMGFPDDWCRTSTVYDQYSLFGNAVVPACVGWVVGRLLGAEEQEAQQYANDQLELLLA